MSCAGSLCFLVVQMPQMKCIKEAACPFNGQDRPVEIRCEEELEMLECTIPKCSGRERFLRSGTLHLVDVVREDGSIAKRMIWLCDECTSRYSVQTWRPPGEQIRLRIQSTFNLADILSARAPRFEPQPAPETSRRQAPASLSSELHYATR